MAEGAETCPQHGVVEDPVTDRASQHAPVPGAEERDRLAAAADQLPPRRGEGAAETGGVRLGLWLAKASDDDDGDDRGASRESGQSRQPERQVRADDADREKGADDRDGE